MRYLIAISVLLAVLAPSLVHAKRAAPPNVHPVTYQGVRYIAPNDDGWRAYVQAWDTTTNKMLWEVTVFRTPKNLLLEEDAQHVYIKRMIIEDGELIVVAEEGRAYSIDLQTRAVKRLKQLPPERPQPNTALEPTPVDALSLSRAPTLVLASGAPGGSSFGSW